MFTAVLPRSAQADDAPTPKPGLPGIQHPFDQVKPTAQLAIAKNADWVAIGRDAVWVGGAEPNTVHRIDPRTSADTLTVPLPGEPCAGLALGFDSLWVPLCGTSQSVVRVDVRNGRIIATIPMGPTGEGGIAASDDSVWFTTDDKGTLVRIDPRTNRVRQTIQIAAGSHNPVVDNGKVWITSLERGLVTEIDAHTGAVIATVPTGPRPRFLTAGAGSIWTLNQGDGSVTRVDAKTRNAIATIKLGVPGTGGDIAYGANRVWVTVLGMPLTVIDPKTNKLVIQWVGPGGDSLRLGHGAIWLTGYREGTLSRVQPRAALGVSDSTANRAR
jgi:YVTN family beta-propeller protein